MSTLNLGKIRFNWTGAYNNSTAYVANDVVSSGGNSYICILASTGNAVSNATYWSIMSSAGTNGTNGSNGTDLGTVLTTQGDVAYRDGSGLQRLAKGTASQQLRMNSGANAPEWFTPGSSGPYTVISSGSVNANNLTITNVTGDFHIEFRYKDSYTAVIWGYGSSYQLSSDNGSSWMGSPNYRDVTTKAMTNSTTGVLGYSTGRNPGIIFEYTGARFFKVTVQAMASSSVRTNLYGIASHSEANHSNSGVITSYSDYSTAQVHNAIKFDFGAISPTADFDYVIYKI